MLNYPSENWSFCIGRWRGVGVRLHILYPLLGLSALTLEESARRLALLVLLVMVVSVALHELVRVIAASRVGGFSPSIVLGPIGGWTKLHLPADPPAHLVTALVGPMTYFVLLVAAGCGLALSDFRDVPQLLLQPTNLSIDSIATASLWPVIGKLFVSVNWCLFLISLLPIDPCAGAQLLRGVLWPVVGRTTASSATSHVALGGAVLFALVALLVYQEGGGDGLLPSWIPYAFASVFLLYGGSRNAQVRRYDVGLAIDEFDSDDEEWLIDEWVEDDREAVLVEHLQDKQQEALDRKRREREANEDARVDAILARLRDSSFEQLSEEDRATLKRASRRYRQRHGHASDEQ